MTDITLSQLGISPENLETKLLEILAQDFWEKSFAGSVDDEGRYHRLENFVLSKLEKQTKETIDTAIEKLASETLGPAIETFIQNYKVQQTNSYGEKKGEAKTFTEYLMDRATNYCMQPVKYNGEPADSYGAKNDQTRITYLINKHLQSEIEKLVQKHIHEANKLFAKGLNETVRMMINETFAKLPKPPQVPIS